MAGHVPPSYPTSCLSERRHDGRIADVALHYSGCIPIARRKHFFDGLDGEAQDRIIRRHAKVASLRQKLETVAQDSNAGASLRDFKASMSQWRAVRGRRGPYGGNSRTASSLGQYHWVDGGVDGDIKASVISFKDALPHDVPGLQNSFPNQKLTVQDLLSDNKSVNPLMQPCEEKEVRYFHLPANNMAWVEEAMARYYQEKRPDPDDFMLNCKTPRSRTRTEMLLRPEFWQGQCAFDDTSEVHARHMRPFSAFVSVDPTAAESLPRNMVLYMPYLHWETDRGRMLSAKCAKKASEHKMVSVSEIVAQARDKASHAAEVAHNHGEQQVAPPSRKRALGQLLFSAATLLEAMEFHTEEQLTFRYLHERPPLHPRRTLDQSYYGALKSTGTRDRDQVVYRGTQPVPHDCLDPSTCQQCRDEIRKVPRLVMVDQLWLWILDEKTVISCFPRRWGNNRPDPSALHKSIKMRLQSARRDDITSAYDIALLVIDECSRVFFDRARPNARVPNMVEMFADSIRHVKYNSAAAFDQFLIWTKLALTEKCQLLNINPEGNLLKEIKDIMDELNIILRVKEEQQAALESFVKNVRLALVPTLRRPGMLGNMPGSHASSWDVLLTATAGSSLGDDLPPLNDEAKLCEYHERQRTKRTLAKADHLLQDLADRRLELATLLEDARNTSAALKDILTLKQQQAGVIEARESVETGLQSLKQSQSIVIFTVVTIVFVSRSLHLNPRFHH
jgi:hypothetical protein